MKSSTVAFGLGVLQQGQGIGIIAAVALSSMSGARNTLPHLGHLNFVVPRIIVSALLFGSRFPILF